MKVLLYYHSIQFSIRIIYVHFIHRFIHRGGENKTFGTIFKFSCVVFNLRNTLTYKIKSLPRLTRDGWILRCHFKNVQYSGLDRRCRRMYLIVK